MTLHTLLLFLLTCVAVSGTPGPNMLLAMSLGVRFGVRRAAWGGLGLCLALAAMALVSALGLGALMATSAVAFETVRWLGVVYLVWLGVQAWRAPPHEAEGPAAEPSGASRGRLFARGLLVSASNPKAVVFLTALLPQFIDAGQPLAPQLAALIAVMIPVEFAWIMIYAAGGNTLAARLSGGAAGRWLNRATGGLLIGAGGLLALARRV
jgi:homoserine/homoserine lactone efflux protein